MRARKPGTQTQLSAAALEASGDDAAQRKAALEILKAALFRGRMIAKERLENGAGGIETSRLISGVTDEVITALWDFTTVHVFRARNAGFRLGRMLRLKPGMACLVLERRTWHQGTLVTEVTITYPGDRHWFIGRFSPTSGG